MDDLAHVLLELSELSMTLCWHSRCINLLLDFLSSVATAAVDYSPSRVIFELCVHVGPPVLCYAAMPSVVSFKSSAI